MKDDLATLSEWLTPLINKLSEQERKKLSSVVARDLRRANQMRIQQQRNPDGSAFDPRKPRNRRKKNLRKKAMFTKLRTVRFLKIESTSTSAAIEWAGRTAHIASIHQYGLRAKIGKGNLQYKYPERQLLGFAATDHALITDLVLKHLARDL